MVKLKLYPYFKHKQYGNISVWWFQKAFSQSRYGTYRKSGRNSCTLIALTLADKICKGLVFQEVGTFYISSSFICYKVGHQLRWFSDPTIYHIALSKISLTQLMKAILFTSTFQRLGTCATKT